MGDFGLSLFDSMAPYSGSSSSPAPSQPQQTTSPTVSYVNQMLGSSTMSFDSQGRYGITEDQKREAFKGAASQILTGIASSMLGKDPTYITQAISQAGQMYKQDLDKASAMNVANRSLQFQEAQTRLNLEKGLTEYERDQLLIEEAKRRAEQDELVRKAAGGAADALGRYLEPKIAELTKVDPVTGKAMLSENGADLVRTNLKAYQIAARAGRMDEAKIYMEAIMSSGIIGSGNAEFLSLQAQSEAAAVHMRLGALQGAEVPGAERLSIGVDRNGNVVMVDSEWERMQKEALQEQINASKRSGRGGTNVDPVLGRADITGQNKASDDVYAAMGLLGRQKKLMASSGDQYALEKEGDKQTAQAWAKAMESFRPTGWNEAQTVRVLEEAAANPLVANALETLIAKLNSVDPNVKHAARMSIGPWLKEMGISFDEEAPAEDSTETPGAPNPRAMTGGKNQVSVRPGPQLNPKKPWPKSDDYMTPP